MKIILNLIIALLFYSCNSQTNSSETQLMKCIYESCLDDGSEFKETILKYENELITKKVLKDNSSGSYINLLKNISNDNQLNSRIGYSFMKEIDNLNYYKFDSIKNCYSKIEKSEKLISFQKKMASLFTSEKINYSEFSNELLKLLDEEDFEESYYKFNVLILFDRMITDTEIGINESIPGYSGNNSQDESRYIYFQINLNEHDQIYHDNKLITEKELELLIFNFLELNTNNSRFKIEATGKTKYDFYLHIQNVITLSVYKMRNLHSHTKYGKSFDKLDSNLKVLIEKMYPEIIVN
jgi:hypothetical protein